MGVPKFYRWISERYPKINEIISDQALLPEFDHLYLDMNGIIHGCTHPNDQDISQVLSERDMMLGIMHYLDRIITIIVKPKVSVYMAIDGVAPRAKLNQQRSRRFRSAKDLAETKAELELKQRQSRGKQGSNNDDTNELSQGKGVEVFDSNCITPGTPFLAKVSECIQYFIRQKCNEDPAWHGLTVVFSGHDIPGEGEHKIMDHIRQMRASKDYQPNNRHCIYGQDADLIMLGLVTHEPHFTILREVVNFNSFNNRNENTLKVVKKFTKESDFQLLHLSVLREYLQMEFCTPATASIPVEAQMQQLQIEQPPSEKKEEHTWDLERVIDDFVFMTFLVGNDFLPHMPTLDISDGAFDLLFDLYKQQRLGWKEGYLTHAGEICNPAELEHYLAAIGAMEASILEQREVNEAQYLKKKRRWDKRDGKPAGPSDQELQDAENARQSDFVSMMQSISHLPVDEYVDGIKPMTETDSSQKDFKGRYYFEKFNFKPIDKPEHLALRKAYMEGLIWCLAYYYKGCISWGWFYPYHYGPMLSDLVGLEVMFKDIRFELGEPLLPFEQLMGCLPPASSILVPAPYRRLMTEPDSPIIQFYPTDFAVDMNGKKNPWEGVNLLPWIDVDLLKKAISENCPPSTLTEAERSRNAFGCVYLYRYNLACTDTVKAPDVDGLVDLQPSHSSVNILEKYKPGKISPSLVFKPELVPGTQIPLAGFPALNVLPILKAELLPMGLNCFGSPSKYPTYLLKLHPVPENALPLLSVLAQNVLGKSLFINWPMMHEGRVVAVSDETTEIKLARPHSTGKSKKGTKNAVKTVQFTKQQADRWFSESTAMHQMYLQGNGVPGSGGVDIGEVKIRLKLLPLQGMKTSASTGAKQKVFGREPAEVPMQLALWQAPAPDPRFVERGPVSVAERFPVGCSVVLTKGKHRGCKGLVVAYAEKEDSSANVKDSKATTQKKGQAQQDVIVKVDILPAELPFGLAIARTVQESYLNSSDAARILKIHPGIFGKITGRLLFEGNYDLGLNLKSSDGTCVIGYTRKMVEKKKQHQSNNGNGKQANAWSAGDSLLVAGSARQPTPTRDKPKEQQEKIIWEYTPQAIRLIQTYRQKFPALFANIAKFPNELRYDPDAIFGANGKAWLPVVREWLDNHATAKLPRCPVTSDSMSYEAVHAVERAADASEASVKERGFPQTSLLKVPGSALYAEGSTTATDVLLASDLNNNEAPELGDRVVNLTSPGIPFGLRGTVVGIHDAASSAGSVEVVMDDEFLGGTSLQGVCSNFRGKLTAWTQLLKMPVDGNRKGLVDKLIPKAAIQSSKRTSKQQPHAAVDKIISSIEQQVKTTKSAPPSTIQEPEKEKAAASEIDTTANSDVSSTFPSERAVSSGRAATAFATSRSMSSGRAASTGRASSTGRGGSRLVAWKEAAGPATKGIGFRGARKSPVSGFSKWKALMENKKDTEISTSRGATSSDELKAMLGVIPSSTSHPAKKKTPNAAASSAELKAILGVSEQSAPAVIAEEKDSPATAPPTALSAADKLLQIMAQQQTQHPGAAFATMPSGLPQHQPVPPGSRSSFNFTYVEQGDGAMPEHQHQQPPPIPTVMPIPQGPFPTAAVPPYPTGPHGYMGQPQSMMMPQVPPGPPPLPQFQQYQPRANAPPPKPAGGEDKNVLSSTDFPPLGSLAGDDEGKTASPPEETKSESHGEGATVTEAITETKGTVNIMAPSAVVAKALP